jgi:hypothetical protein
MNIASAMALILIGGFLVCAVVLAVDLFLAR